MELSRKQKRLLMLHSSKVHFVPARQSKTTHSQKTKAKIEELDGFEILAHPPYSSDMFPIHMFQDICFLMRLMHMRSAQGKKGLR
ncbi:hypothetical protein KIN20_032734 [Parelaphostrongylus tenuis]|uniref:Uncharacterized protein n=1 Tax=Parelaphostrongylus tenuis TaxID=148309 RepID=A0AAD5WHQ0_PARTN|nr:hypothetical protein KIN20_032734 [Parelaphostrongylus tenuis]